MRGSRRAVIAMVWLLGTAAATAITIEGVRVVGSNVINGESAINPRQANAALGARTTTTSATPVTPLAATTTVTTEAPTTTATEAPTAVAPTEPATTPTTARSGPTTTHKKTVATTATTAKPPATTPAPTAPAPTVTVKPVPPPPTSPPTTPPTTPPPPVTTTTSTTAQPQCTIQQTRTTEGGFVTACFTSQKVSVLGFVAFNGWQGQQTSSGQVAVVKFTKGTHIITVVAYWSGGPQWQVNDSEL